MQTTIIVLIVLIVTISVSLLFVLISNNYRQRKRQNLLISFRELGIDNNLAFTSQEVMHDIIIGLDGRKNKLLVLKEDDGNFNWFMVNLRNIKRITVKKLYQHLNRWNTDKKILGEDLHQIVLQLETIDKQLPVNIAFYDSTKNDVFEIADLEEKANQWKAILSQITIRKFDNVI